MCVVFQLSGYAIATVNAQVDYKFEFLSEYKRTGWRIQRY